MGRMQFPPEDLVKKVVYILSRTVGVAAIIGGIVSLISFFLFAREDDSSRFGVVTLVGSVLSFAVAIIVMKYMPAFTLSRYRKLKDNPPF